VCGWGLAAAIGAPGALGAKGEIGATGERPTGAPGAFVGTFVDALKGVFVGGQVVDFGRLQNWGHHWGSGRKRVTSLVPSRKRVTRLVGVGWDLCRWRDW
jgi:hypothetical protein